MKKKEGAGKQIFHGLVDPILPKFKLKDVLQVVIGATILAVPIGFTEETWRLGETLPMLNILLIMLVSVIFISLFTYYHYHKHLEKNKWNEFGKRVIFTYFISFLAVAILMTLIQKAPWGIDLGLAFKRIVIVTLPSSMSAVIADTLK